MPSLSNDRDDISSEFDDPVEITMESPRRSERGLLVPGRLTLTTYPPERERRRMGAETETATREDI